MLLLMMTVCLMGNSCQHITVSQELYNVTNYETIWVTYLKIFTLYIASQI